jgi:beta-mannanase
MHPDAQPLRPSGKLVPSSGAMFGETPGGYHGNGFRMMENKIGRKYDIIQHYHPWGQYFPTKDERALQRNGRILMIGWESERLAPIAQGRYDGLIRARARSMKSLGRMVFLRWGYEMNGDWKTWGGPNNMPNGPSKFRRAWRRMHDIFQSVGASNVVWVWAPNFESVPNAGWNNFRNYYPGDDYVDWVGIDGFNWGTSRSWSHWTRFRRIVHDVYHAYHNRKPIMIAETASVERGGSKAKWIRNARNVIKNRFPAIAAFMYFNGADIGYDDVNWAATSSQSALRAYRAMSRDPYYNR